MFMEPTPFDVLFLIAVPVIIIYLVWEFLKSEKERATREKEQEAALEHAFNQWVMEPSEENRKTMDDIVEEMYGPRTNQDGTQTSRRIR